MSPKHLCAGLCAVLLGWSVGPTRSGGEECVQSAPIIRSLRLVHVLDARGAVAPSEEARFGERSEIFRFLLSTETDPARHYGFREIPE